MPGTPPAAFFPAPYRIPDEPSPKKRQRCSSTSRQPRASSSATPDDININAEREASAMRMFDVWSALAQKYSRRIDEDDIVDLVTGEIVKDRGVLSAESSWKFGRFAEDSVDVDDSTGTDDDEEDDVDELDAFARPVQVSPRAVPPVRQVDPADAKDLEDFMEAERRRREECGEDEDEEEEEEEESEDDGHLEDAETTFNGREPTPAPPTSRPADSDDSDDELGNWGVVDESNIVHLVENTGAEIIEILDSPTVSPTRSTTPRPETPPPRSKRTPDRKPHPRMQLHTPPRSRTPSIPSSIEVFIPVATPPLPSPTKRVDGDRTQVQTRSRSQARSSPRSRRNSIQEPLPRLNLAEVVTERGRSVHKSVPKRERREEPKASRNSTVDRPKILKRSTPKFKEFDPVFKVEHSPWPPPELRSQSTRKRKRKSLSLDNNDDVFAHGNLCFSGPRKTNLIVNNLDVGSSSSSFDSSPTKTKTRSSSVSAKSKSKRPAVKSEEESHSDTNSELEPEMPSTPSHHHARQMSAIPSYYPAPAFYPYPPYPPPDTHPAVPLQEHAQFIISQAMHQLSTLFTTPWPAQPFTPPRHSSATASTSQSTPYFYPTTPHHPHAHPYVFDSGASVGTLPPSSPLGSSPPSSSPSRSNGARRASLVPRSRSRGRRVSFKLDDNLRDDETDSQHVPASPEHDLDDEIVVERKDKGKGKQAAAPPKNLSLRKPKGNREEFTL
ncbi:hypothetical protein K438DRAFT_1974239 [Mycena galopus ATCC 62051]|nr:hypothetical protein K438DRAFT_1974239 [Mycena galopus ATCC 62051]